MRREPLRARRLRLLDLLGVALDDAVPPFNFLLVGVRVALAVQEELGRLLEVLAGLRVDRFDAAASEAVSRRWRWAGARPRESPRWRGVA